MENKLDKLFRDKLEHHSMQPSAQAWDKVAACFPKKNNTIVWAWRIAAAIAIVSTIGILLMNSWSGEAGSTIANESTQETKEQVRPTETKKTELVEENKQEPKQGTATPKQTVAPKVFNRPVEQPMAKNKQEAVQTQNENIAIATTETNTQTIELPAVTETKKQATQEKTLVIVYTLAPVESKPVVEEPVKTKTMQRMLTFAKDVKGGETTALASVRDWKDSFFGTEETARVEKKNSNN